MNSPAVMDLEGELWGFGMCQRAESVVNYSDSGSGSKPPEIVKYVVRGLRKECEDH